MQYGVTLFQKWGGGGWTHPARRENLPERDLQKGEMHLSKILFIREKFHISFDHFLAFLLI